MVLCIFTLHFVAFGAYLVKDIARLFSACNESLG